MNGLFANGFPFGKMRLFDIGACIKFSLQISRIEAQKIGWRFNQTQIITPN